MSQTWEETTEIVTGLLIESRISLTLVRPELFFPPYDDVVKELKKGRSPEELVEKCGFSLIQTAHEAVMNMNGLGESIKWIKLLEKTKSLYEAGQQFTKWGKKLSRGEDINWSEVTEQARKVEIGQAGDFIPLSDVKRGELPFIKSGWANIDNHLGGIPEVGMILIGGDPGIGKTTSMGKFALSFVREHKDKKVAIFSLEMILNELAKRFDEVEVVDEELQKRVLLCETPLNADAIINKSATIENLGLICVDFADLVVEEDTEAAYAKMYRTFMFGSKQLHVPIIVLVQLLKNKKGLPRPSHLRYTKMAEAFAWMILMLYDPSKDWDSEEQDQVLPIKKGAAYILVWKIRGGFRIHKNESPGAILMPFSGEKGWSSDLSKWHSLKKVS